MRGGSNYGVGEPKFKKKVTMPDNMSSYSHSVKVKNPLLFNSMF